MRLAVTTVAVAVACLGGASASATDPAFRAMVTITAVSRSRIPHNITILSPAGQSLKSVDIRAKETVRLDVTLSQPGRYVFYCDKLLHRHPFGMDGVLVAK